MFEFSMGVTANGARCFILRVVEGRGWLSKKNSVTPCTELGVRSFQPVITARTQFPRLNVEKARLQAIEAAEQTERLDIPEILDPRPLLDVLSIWDDTPILFADESGEAMPAHDGVAKHKDPIAILIGPEGGFNDAERGQLRARDSVCPVTLGPRILRADTDRQYYV